MSSTPGKPFTTLAPPPATALAVSYFSPLMAPTPVATRYPQPSKTEDTINAFLRVEGAGGQATTEMIHFNVSIILHAYAPNEQESMAEQTMALALAHGGNAQGGSIIHPSTQVAYFVSSSAVTATGMKYQDPAVNLVRYRGMVTWTVHGRPVPPLQDY